jgi:hypothetical protein
MFKKEIAPSQSTFESNGTFQLLSLFGQGNKNTKILLVKKN